MRYPAAPEVVVSLLAALVLSAAHAQAPEAPATTEAAPVEAPAEAEQAATAGSAGSGAWGGSGASAWHSGGSGAPGDEGEDEPEVGPWTWTLQAGGIALGLAAVLLALVSVGMRIKRRRP